VYEVGSKVFVFSGMVWQSARVLLHKKSGWHLLVTEHGKEINRQAFGIQATPGHVFNRLVTDGLIIVLGTKEDSLLLEIAKAKCLFASAAWWFVRLSDGDENVLRKLADLWDKYDIIDEELQSIPH